MAGGAQAAVPQTTGPAGDHSAMDQSSSLEARRCRDSQASTDDDGTRPGSRDRRRRGAAPTFSRAERKRSTRLQSRLYIRVEALCQRAKSFTRRGRRQADGKLWPFTILRKAGSAFAIARFYPKCRKGFRAGSPVLPKRTGSRFTTSRNRHGSPVRCK